MSISHTQLTARAAKGGGPVDKRWRGGFVAITFTNVSQTEVVNVAEWDVEAQHEVEVTDAAGKPVPLSADGEKLAASRHDRLGYRVSSVTMTLRPGEQFTDTIDVARLFQIRPGVPYTIRVRRSAGLPTYDRSGRKIEQELSRTLVITGHEDQ